MVMKGCDRFLENPFVKQPSGLALRKMRQETRVKSGRESLYAHEAEGRAGLGGRGSGMGANQGRMEKSGQRGEKK